MTKADTSTSVPAGRLSTQLAVQITDMGKALQPALYEISA
jgi:hypothetical protein